MRILKIFFVLFIFHLLFSCHPRNVILPEYSDQEIKDADLAILHVVNNMNYKNGFFIAKDTLTNYLPIKNYLKMHSYFNKVYFYDSENDPELLPTTLRFAKDSIKIFLPSNKSILRLNQKADFILFIQTPYLLNAYQYQTPNISYDFGIIKSKDQLYTSEKIDLIYAIWDNREGEIVSYGRLKILSGKRKDFKRITARRILFDTPFFKNTPTGTPFSSLNTYTLEFSRGRDTTNIKIKPLKYKNELSTNVLFTILGAWNFKYARAITPKLSLHCAASFNKLWFVKINGNYNFGARYYLKSFENRGVSVFCDYSYFDMEYESVRKRFSSYGFGGTYRWIFLKALLLDISAGLGFSPASVKFEEVKGNTTKSVDVGGINEYVSINVGIMF